MLKGKETVRRVVRLLLRKLPKGREALMSVGEFIGFLSEFYRRNREVRNFLISPFVPRERKLELLSRLMERFSVPREALEVFEHMLDTNAFSLLPEMKRLYDHEVEKLMRISKGFLYLPKEMDGEEVGRIVSGIQKALGRELQVEVAYDEKLIGGFLFRTSGFVIDASVKRQLERLLVRGG